MTSWLEYAAQMLAFRDDTSLVKHYLHALTELLSIAESHLVAPCVDGRQLQVVGSHPSLSWEVDNFEHPFAHILQHRQPMLLGTDKLPYWLGDSAFAELTAVRRSGDGVLLCPLPGNGGQIRAFVVFIGQETILSELLLQSAWRQFSHIFMHQWLLLTELTQQHSQHDVLRASLSRMQEERQRDQLSFQLSHFLIGQSQPMQRLHQQTIKAAQSALSVLIQGETGTGKELVARAVHQLSDRAQHSFIAINCAAIPDSLLESELFGYEKGAFSGASTAKKGLLQQADGGTLFLDEIGDMPLTLQAKLLRVLETRQFRPIGGSREVSSNFRLVAATHVALADQVKSKKFRQDLYYRLCQYPLALPPLRERLADLKLLAEHFVDQFNQQQQRQVRGIHYSVLDRLQSYTFPGNVRELRHLIEYGCAQANDDEELQLPHLGPRLEMLINEPSLQAEAPESIPQNSAACAQVHDLKLAVRCYETRIIRTRLEQFNGDRAKAAESLGLPKRTLAHKCQKLEIDH
ncbi:sigma-54 interaction domain-containing protein [Celerinatantimonas sp. YJH-8]|uniref:sigma-54 interaction domain-containing protein n=1 Tax=Celerinatantimonas sp. YJH-8 TaxID=3228714 RepID=UPI0038C26609